MEEKSQMFVQTNMNSCSNSKIPSVGKVAGFVSEEMLVSAFETSLYYIHRNDDWQFLREFDAANGIADFITFELNHDWHNALAIGHISPRWAYALFDLPYKKRFTITEFSILVGTSTRRAYAALREYAELGFCEEDKLYNGWLKVKQPKPVATRIDAVEAKLRNWKRALWQAYRYLDFATQSWVVLDEKAIRPANENLEEFKRLNIGLVGISTEGDIRVIHTPIMMSPKSTSRFWYANVEIARRLQSGLTL